MSRTIALNVILILATASAARAQTSTVPERPIFANFDIGGQVTTSSFSGTSTTPVFNETATINLNQTVGTGLIVGLRGGYLFNSHIGVAIGVWGSSGKGDSTVVASIPDPLVTGKFKTVTVTGTDLKQTNVGVDFQLVWTRPITDRFRLAVFGGPTIIHVSQDVGSIAVDSGGQASPSSEHQSATTAKAGNIGADTVFDITKRFGVGVFVRYAGGKADLPAASSVTVGGTQVGARLQMWF
jgi:hypothetical protein